MEMGQPTPKRQPLQALPALPLNKRYPGPIQTIAPPSPSLCTRSKPSASVNGACILTPPITPVQNNEISETNGRLEELPGLENSRAMQENKREATTVTTPRPSFPPLGWDETALREFAGKYQLQEEFGRGVWSKVNRARLLPTSSAPELTISGPLTPPISPLVRLSQASTHETVAVKIPTRRDAFSVLQNEARILTYLHQFPATSTSIVPFHGFDTLNHSIIMDAIPLTLETHLQTASRHSRANFTTRTMFDPVIGTTQWTHIAISLIEGLAHLHAHACVHGDIKPPNILLAPDPRSLDSLRPLYCDFSSSTIRSPHTSTTTSTPSDPIDRSNDAITTTFAAPELLAGYCGGAGGATGATMASDVFALGVTLMVAATGEWPYAGARGEMQRLAMARVGRPLEFARGGEQGTRIMKGKLVVRVLEGSLEEDEGRRVRAEEWRGRGEEMGLI